ncbi:PaaI family thioesterase [Euzebya tangerina]|uniref:PaaI family thioesterase n=1 Tax=Euzebya tangerina TaxID=591198 RepID=UPI000E316222|nr:PaaI family thioesterase [Euzebya tangerina]
MLTPDLINTSLANELPGKQYVCHEIGEDYVVCRQEIGPEVLRPGELVSGPTQFAMCDGALWYLSFVVLGRIELMAVTSELSIRFLRPAQGTVLWARATLDKPGRRTIVGTVRVWCDEDRDRPVSTAQGTYVVPRS